MNKHNTTKKTKISDKARVPMRITAIKHVLPYIIDFKKVYGVAPTHREIASAFGKKSVYTASLYLQILVKEKYIKLNKYTHRQITILKRPNI